MRANLLLWNIRCVSFGIKFILFVRFQLYSLKIVCDRRWHHAHVLCENGENEWRWDLSRSDTLEAWIPEYCRFAVRHEQFDGLVNFFFCKQTHMVFLTCDKLLLNEKNAHKFGYKNCACSFKYRIRWIWIFRRHRWVWNYYLYHWERKLWSIIDVAGSSKKNEQRTVKKTADILHAIGSSPNIRLFLRTRKISSPVQFKPSIGDNMVFFVCVPYNSVVKVIKQSLYWTKTIALMVWPVWRRTKRCFIWTFKSTFTAKTKQQLEGVGQVENKFFDFLTIFFPVFQYFPGRAVSRASKVSICALLFLQLFVWLPTCL